MKICAIGLRGIPNVMGGIESHCQQLYPMLINHGVEVTVISRSPYSKDNNFRGVNVIPLFSFRNKFLETILHTFCSILYARFILKPDILHIHAIGPSLLVPFAKMLGLKVVMTHHGEDYNRAKWSYLAKKILKLGERFGVRYSNATICVGKSLTKKLKDKYLVKSDDLFFIPNGCPENFTSQQTEYPVPKDINILKNEYFLFVGRLVPEKGVHDLIDAFRSISSQTNCKLLVVGAADFEDAYFKKILGHQSDDVIFAGKRTGDELLALYQNARLFILPSFHEGLPIVALEAMSLSTPVLLSDIEPNLDIGLNRQHYFSVGDVNMLAVKLLEKYDSSNSDSIISNYDWVKIAKQTLLVFQRIAS